MSSTQTSTSTITVEQAVPAIATNGVNGVHKGVNGTTNGVYTNGHTTEAPKPREITITGFETRDVRFPVCTTSEQDKDQMPDQHFADLA